MQSLDSATEQARAAPQQFFLASALTPQGSLDDPAFLTTSWPLLSTATSSSAAPSATTAPTSVPSSAGGHSNSSSSSSPSKSRNNANMPTAAAASASGGILDGASSYGSSYYSSAYPSYSVMYGTTPSAAAAYYQQMASTGIRPSTAAAASLQYALGSSAAATAPYYGASLLGSAAAATAAASSNAYDYTSAYGANYYSGMRNGYYGLGSAYQSLSSGLDATALAASYTARGEGKKSKSSKKKKAAGSISPPEAAYVRVFVWDVEDASLLSSAQLEMAVRLAPSNKDPHVLRQTVLQAQSYIFPSTEHIDLNEHDVCNVEDATIDENPPQNNNNNNPQGASDVEGSTVSSNGSVASANSRGVVASDAMRRMAARYTHLRQVYADYGCNRQGLLEQCRGAKEFEECFGTVDSLLGRRVENVLRCLEIVTLRSLSSVEKYANVILSSESVASTTSQLLLAGAAPFVPIENVYSCAKLGKEAVFERLIARFGKKCSFIIVSSCLETQTLARKAAYQEQMAVWPVSSPDTFVNLYSAQNDFLLGARC